VGETHGRMKVEHATLKGLNINTLNVQPLPATGRLSGLWFWFHFFSTGFHRFAPVVIHPPDGGYPFGI